VFLNRIADARRLCARGAMTQVELARQVGLSSRHLRRIEKGLSAPSADLLVRIAHVLGVSVDDLVGGPKRLRPGERVRM
jgi:transcriptional regulator with XRE-family HTH domain